MSDPLPRSALLSPPRQGIVFLSLAAASCVALLLLRLGVTIHFGPLVFTSGLEEEVLFALWKWIQRLPVYQDPYSPPFAQSYYNWLFYALYGLVGRTVQNVASVPDSALPSIFRLTTLALTGVMFCVLERLIRIETFARRLHSRLLSATICCSPLIGYWAITARPDLAAICFELCGMYFVLQAERAGRNRGFWLSVPLFYGAWAIKQSSVASWLAVCIWLFSTRRRGRAALFFLIPAALFGLTLAAGSVLYRNALVLAQLDDGYSVMHSLQLFVLSLIKAPFFGAGLLAAIHRIAIQRKSDVLAWASLISLFIALVTSGLGGAAENYFIPSAVYASIMLCRACWRHSAVLLTALCAIQISVVGVISAGWYGKLTPQPEPELLALTPSLTRLGKPAYVLKREGNLPWFQPKPPYFVTSVNYGPNRLAGRRFAYGGIGAMIKSGQIAIVACRKTDNCSRTDRIDLTRFPTVAEDRYWKYLSTHQ